MRSAYLFLILTLSVSVNCFCQTLNSTNIDDHSVPGCYDLPPLDHSHNYPTCKGRWVKISSIDIANYQCPSTTAIKVVDDNFDGNTLDFNTWRIGYPWGGELTGGAYSFGGMPYSNGNLSVANGYLYMRPKVQSISQGSFGVTGWNNQPIPTKNYDYTEPALSTLMKWGYGKFEIRCKMSDDPVGLNTALWLFGGCQNEIDFFETFDDINEGGIYDNDPDREHVNMRIKTSVYSAIGGCGGSRFSRDYHTKVPYGQTLNQWHTYTVYWDEYSIQMEIDGVSSGKFFTSIFNFYPGPSKKLCAELEDGDDYRQFSTYPYATDFIMPLILDVAVREGEGNLPTTLGNDREMIVDYVKVWQSKNCGEIKNLCGVFDNSETVNPTLSPVEFGYQINMSPNNCGWHLQGNSGSISVFSAIAENEIALLPGFEAENITVFSAYIQPCAYNNRKGTPAYDSVFVDNTEYGLNKLELSPNPNRGSFKVNLLQSEKGIIKVYNNLGVLVYEKEINEEQSEILVNLDNINQGFYYITLETNTRTYTSKFVITE